MKKFFLVALLFGVIALAITIGFHNNPTTRTRIFSVAFLAAGAISAVLPLIFGGKSNTSISIAPTREAIASTSVVSAAITSTQGALSTETEISPAPVSGQQITENLKNLENAQRTINAAIAKLSESSKQLCLKTCPNGSGEKIEFCNQVQSELVNCGALLNSLSKANYLNTTYVNGLVAQANIVEARAKLTIGQLTNRLVGTDSDTK